MLTRLLTSIVDNDSIVSAIKNGSLPANPPGVHDDVLSIVRACWVEKKGRPVSYDETCELHLTILQSFVDLRIRILSVQSDAAELTTTDLLPIVPELETATLHNTSDLPPNRPTKSSRNPSTGSNVSNLKKPVTSLPLLPVRADQLPYNDPNEYQRQETDLSYVNVPAPIETVIAIAHAAEYIPADENLRSLYEQSNIG